MRFKQTKPQHVKKKEKKKDSLDNSNLNTFIQTCNTDTKWSGSNHVDVGAEKISCHNSDYKTALKPQNGHDTAMDIKPMLEDLYSHNKLQGSKTLLKVHLFDPSTPVITENDVIIHGRRPIFSEPEETKIAAQMNQWKEQGIKYTRMDIVKMASEYAIHLGKRPQCRPLTVKWFRSFLTRHPECYIRKFRKTKTERPKKQYFNQLDTILTSYNLKDSPHCIFSLVEHPLSMLKNRKVFTSEDVSVNGMKSHRKSASLGNVPSSLLLCGSAAGQALPPFLLFTGKMTNKSFLSSLTPGAGWMTCPSGQVTSQVLVSFLRDHFLLQAPGRAEDTLILLIDSKLERSMSQAVVDIGAALKIVLVTSQTSVNPQLHPMVVGCCDALQLQLSQELQKPMYTSEPTSSYASICETLCRLYHRNMKAENLHSTFRKAGVFPFNPLICRKQYRLVTTFTNQDLGHSSKNSGHASKSSGQVSEDLILDLSRGQEEDDMEVVHLDVDKKTVLKID